jgi:hypothetical protein
VAADRLHVLLGFALAALSALACAPAAAGGANEQEAYDAMKRAEAALRRAEAAREAGAQPERDGDRIGISKPGRSRLSDQYWERQQKLDRNEEAARRRYERARERWREAEQP